MGKKCILTIMLVALSILGIFIYIKKGEDTSRGISRAEAYRQAAIVLGYKAENEYENYFDEKSLEYWFVPYINYLYSKGYIDTELIEPDCAIMSEQLTIEEVNKLIDACNYDFTDSIKQNELQNIKEEMLTGDTLVDSVWHEILEELIEIYNLKEDLVYEETALFGTSACIYGLEAWCAVTDSGTYMFEGFAIDSYIDCMVELMLLEGQVLEVTKKDDTAEYINVIIREENDKAFIRVSGYERSFELEKSIGIIDEAIADVTIASGVIKKVVLKNERISGQINSIKDDFVEIEGYGTFKLSDKLYISKEIGEKDEISRSELVVGNDIYEFVIANDEICGIYMVREVEADKIRVVISTSDYASLYHNELTCMSDMGLVVVYNDRTEEVAAGEVYSITKENEELKQGRIVIEAKNGGCIECTDISRKGGTPKYPGKLEISLTDNGMLIINDVYVEDYLKLVLPSEMPSAYSIEALKAQAVCARSYAYMHIKQSSCAELGAHVNDTTEFQVYNNLPANENASRAVDETYGKVLLYNGEPATTYYYSTSWGYSADVSVWGNDISQLPYLSEVKLSDAESVNVNDDMIFEDHIKNCYENDWESTCPWYRWNTSLSINELSSIVNKNISEYTLNKPEDVEILQSDGSYVSMYVASVGDIKNILILNRSVGGIVTELLINGTNGTVKINKTGAIRNILGCKETIYNKNDGTTADGQKYFPSGFFVIDEIIEEGVLTGYKFLGGGFGHGIGMSQNGANEMAKQGIGYEEILGKFYPGTVISDVK